MADELGKQEGVEAATAPEAVEPTPPNDTQDLDIDILEKEAAFGSMDSQPVEVNDSQPLELNDSQPVELQFVELNDSQMDLGGKNLLPDLDACSSKLGEPHAIDSKPAGCSEVDHEEGNVLSSPLFDPVYVDDSGLDLPKKVVVDDSLLPSVLLPSEPAANECAVVDLLDSPDPKSVEGMSADKLLALAQAKMESLTSVEVDTPAQEHHGRKERVFVSCSLQLQFLLILF